MKNQNRHIRKITRNGKEELIERLTFYYSTIPETEEELWEVIKKEFPLLPREKIAVVKEEILGTLHVIPEEPQPKPESFLKYPELSIYHCGGPKTVTELIERIEKAFPGIPFENLVPLFGICSIYFTQKK